MFCHRLGVQNARETPKQIVRTSELYTGVVVLCEYISDARIYER